MTAILTGFGWIVMLGMFVLIARAELRGEGVFHYHEDGER